MSRRTDGLPPGAILSYMTERETCGCTRPIVSDLRSGIRFDQERQQVVAFAVCRRCGLRIKPADTDTTSRSVETSCLP